MTRDYEGFPITNLSIRVYKQKYRDACDLELNAVTQEDTEKAIFEKQFWLDRIAEAENLLAETKKRLGLN